MKATGNKTTERAELLNIIHTHIDRNPGIDPKFVWGRVYKMISITQKINLFKEAKKKKLKVIDYLESENLIEDACGIAQILLSGDGNDPKH